MGFGFGLGIGMQGQLKDYSALYADAYKQKAALDAAKKAKKEAADSAQMSKLLKSVWVDGSKYHRVLVPEAEKVYVDASEKLNELQAEHPNDWVARAQPELAKASSQLGVLRNQTEQYRKIEALPNTADPVQKKTREALGWANNKQTLLAAIGSDVSGSVTTTPDGNIVFNKQYYDPKDDMRDNVAKTLSQKQFELDQKYNQVTKGAFTQTNSIKRVAKNAAQAQVIADELNKTFKLNITADEIPNVEDVAGAYYDSNPDAEKQMDFFHQNDYYDYNTNKEKMTPDERAQSKRDNFITGVQSKLGANLNTTYVKNSAPKSGGSGDAYDEGKKTPFVEKKVTTSWDDGTEVHTHEFTAMHRQLLPMSELSLAPSDYFVNMETGGKVTVGNKIYNFKSAEFDVAPVYKAGVSGHQEGTIVQDIDLKYQPKSSYEYKTVMIGVATLPNQKKGVSSVIPIDMAKEALVNKAGSEKKGAMLRGQIDAAEEYAKKLNEGLKSGGKKYGDDEIVKIMINGKEISAKAGDLRKKKYNDSQFYK